MDEIRFTARFPDIKRENLAEFKRIVSVLIEITKSEAGNLEYDWFLNADETVCVVRETYASSDAVLDHMVGMTELLPELSALGGGMESACYGTPSAALLQAAPMLEGAVFKLFGGRDTTPISD